VEFKQREREREGEKIQKKRKKRDSLIADHWKGIETRRRHFVEEICKFYYNTLETFVQRRRESWNRQSIFTV